MSPLKIRLLQIALRALAVLPWPLLRACGRCAGACLWIANGRARQVTETNLALCLSELDARQRRELARASLRDLAETGFEFVKVWGAPPRQVLAAVREIDGEDVLDRARAQGRGVLLLVPHLGNWEVVGICLGQRYGLTGMYLPSDNPAMNELVRAARSRSGSTLVPADTGGVRSILKALKRNELVAVLPDQVPKNAGVEPAPFFGQPALTMTLAGNLLQKTGAVAVMCAALRIDGGFRLVYRAPDPALYDADAARSLAALNRSVETLVREAPAQYQWEYKRLKARRGPEHDIYKRRRTTA